MIVFVEGLSKSGKTTLCNKLLKKNSDYIYFKGAGQINIGYGEDWLKYNFEMHRVIERLDELNNFNKIILWDRGLSECIYSHDEMAKKNIFRISKSHKNKMVLYVNVPEHKFLKERYSKEGKEDVPHIQRYGTLLDSFYTKEITTDKDENHFITDNKVDEAIEYINHGLNANK